ncbi:hypothetical protein ACFGW7_03665 [Pasteurella multocida]
MGKPIKQTFTRDFITQACKQAHISIKELPEHVGLSHNYLRYVLCENKPVSKKLAAKLHTFFSHRGVWADWWCLVEKSNELPNL